MKYYKIKSWSLFLVVSFSFTLFSGLFLKNVYDLQFTNSEYFQEQALSYRIKSETLKAKRGSIYDKNLNPLATSTQAFNIGIYPNKISNIKEASVLLAPFVQKDRTEIANRILNSNRFFLDFFKKITPFFVKIPLSDLCCSRERSSKML